MEKKIRISFSETRIRWHDRGAKVLANAFRDAGMEVIYLGLRQTPEMIVNAAIQEDADVIGISILSGAHMTIFPKIIKLMKDNKINDVLLIGGGVIPSEDIEKLKQEGVTEIFGPGTSTEKINQFLKDWFKNNPRD